MVLFGWVLDFICFRSKTWVTLYLNTDQTTITIGLYMLKNRSVDLGVNLEAALQDHITLISAESHAVYR